MSNDVSFALTSSFPNKTLDANPGMRGNKFMTNCTILLTGAE
jgi:hypothetical protein